MKKVFKLNNLDCAHCAAKMERGIAKINGVTAASVSFMTQRLTIECDEADMDRVLGEAKKIIAKIEPDCTVA